tara:strand:- start:1473 stop:2282 length:810 start_codon:yes stop_codon:yes gene_type:complete
MKVLRLGQSLCSSGGASVPNLDFVFTVDTSIAGSSGVGFMALVMNHTPINCDIDWGDGTSDTGVTTNITHDYTATTGAGTYTITASGTISIYFNNGGDKLKMTNIANWGLFKMRDANKNTFKGCANMTATATDAPTMEGTDLRGLFYNCYLFNGDVSNWSPPTGTYRMDRCFQDATAFNRSIGDWDISAIGSSYASGFFAAFSGTALYTNTPTSTVNLDAIYIGWGAQSVQASQTVDFGAAKYTGGGAAAAGKAVLVAAGWTIADGGIA